ncbi:MAG: hypothetical protein WC455_22445 [Dehalococcoidia bacterium]
MTCIYGKSIKTDFIELFANGVIVGRKGYAWDGPSGPTFDTKNTMRGSLVHDIGYQLMREGRLPHSYREYFDKLLYDTLREDGMSWVRAQYWYRGVAWGADSACLPKNDRPILVAP